MTLKEALKNKYPGSTNDELETLIADMAKSVEAGENPDDVLHEEGLEPDYVLDLLEYLTINNY